MSGNRTQALTVITRDRPAVLNGAPMLPTYWAQYPSAATLRVGPSHIHARKTPVPTPSPAGPYVRPPASPTPCLGQWTVATLPDPPAGGYYWLGDPSGADGTLGIRSGARQWAATDAVSGAPSWRSFFPFKPSVRAHDSYLPDGGVVHHPKGVHFNSHFIEHMWLDFGRDRRQAFTWMVVAMVVGYPSPHYTHHILDAGRNPDAVGFPRISADACSTPRRISDGLAYRTALSVSPSRQIQTATVNAVGRNTIIARANAAERPKLFFGVWDGTHSKTGSIDTSGRHYRTGTVENSAGMKHRYYVLGRRQGFMAQTDASHILVFEIRAYAGAISVDSLQAHYDQFASLYHFNRYRSL